jgi:hypothetical protein
MAFSPIFINNLYSYSITRSIPFIGRNLSFLVLLAINALGLWRSYALQESGDVREETVEDAEPERL